MVEEPLHLVDVGGSLGIDVDFLHDENIRVDLIDLGDESFQIPDDLVLAHQDTIAEAIEEEVDTPAAELDVVVHDDEALRPGWRRWGARRAIDFRVFDVVETGMKGIAGPQERDGSDQPPQARATENEQAPH